MTDLKRLVTLMSILHSFQVVFTNVTNLRRAVLAAQTFTVFHILRIFAVATDLKMDLTAIAAVTF